MVAVFLPVKMSKDDSEGNSIGCYLWKHKEIQHSNVPFSNAKKFNLNFVL